MALDGSFFLLLGLLAENVFVLGVSLREVVETEALVRFHIATALVVALDEKIDAPLDFGGRTLASAAEILVVLDFELADVLLDLAQIFVNGRHVVREAPILHATGI